ncbi:hypothetical protein H5410_013552 [Solanum commersonii]|uniref:Uncharacterized protein n=1 Tax=Solanum commersonii TaxID=4109 RepID=A0A9J5ZNK1_SOLCO|nr:hypothetical protein H5410_013552 [Solanum commersonii]
MACEEAELGSDKFNYVIAVIVRVDTNILTATGDADQLNKANFETGASVLTVEHMQDVVRRRVSPLF